MVRWSMGNAGAMVFTRFYDGLCSGSLFLRFITRYQGVTEGI